MKQMRLQILTLVVVLLAVVSGCARQAATPTLDARPETLPTLTPTPLPVQTSPLPHTSPLPVPDGQTPGQVAIPAAAEAAVYWAVNDLAERLGVSRETVRVIGVQSVEWSDSSLGCPEPGMVYAQVITPGYLIVLEAGERRYEYHAAEGSDSAVFCQNKMGLDTVPGLVVGVVDALAGPAVELAQADLAERLDVEPASIVTAQVREVDFFTADLDCSPPRGIREPAARPATAGLEVILQVGEQQFKYHVLGSRLVFCGQ